MLRVNAGRDYLMRAVGEIQRFSEIHQHITERLIDGSEAMMRLSAAQPRSALLKAEITAQ